jgi:transcriptional regulator with XRE-family HTH domain
MKWEELRGELRSISDADARFNDLVAQMVEEITRRRNSLGLTQQQVAERANVKQPAIARMEGGGVIPRMDTLMKVATALEMEVLLVPKEHNEEAVALAR